MFEFFRGGGTHINPGYWQEKIRDGRERAWEFDFDTFRVAALVAFDRATEEWDADQRAEARAELIGEIDDEPDEHGAANVLRNFQFTANDETRFRFDLSEGFSDCKIWDYHYIWCCRAIVWAISQYDAHHAIANQKAGRHERLERRLSGRRITQHPSGCLRCPGARRPTSGTISNWTDTECL